MCVMQRLNRCKDVRWRRAGDIDNRSAVVAKIVKTPRETLLVEASVVRGGQIGLGSYLELNEQVFDRIGDAIGDQI